MHYVSVDNLKPGMVLGQEIYDAEGRTLIMAEAPLTEEDIGFLSFLGILGVYINDEAGKDVKSGGIVNTRVRKDAVSVVTKFFNRAKGDAIKEKYGVEVSREEEDIQNSVSQVVNEVLSDEQVMNTIIEVRTYDGYTFFHSADVAILAGVIGEKCHLKDTEIRDLVTAGFLHDVGKVFIDPDIINAPRRLTDEEREKMMAHPDKGFEYLRVNFSFNENVLRAVHEHHEWYNGGGYPSKKGGNALAFISRVLKCADVYDAMTGRRVYHEPYLPGEVMEYFMGRSGMEFDPSIVKTMSRTLCVYPAGCDIELSDGRRGIVVENHVGAVLRPTVFIPETGESVDLLHDRDTMNLTITKLAI